MTRECGAPSVAVSYSCGEHTEAQARCQCHSSSEFTLERQPLPACAMRGGEEIRLAWLSDMVLTPRDARRARSAGEKTGSKADMGTGVYEDDMNMC